jgi:hypothetical protein
MYLHCISIQLFQEHHRNVKQTKKRIMEFVSLLILLSLPILCPLLQVDYAVYTPIGVVEVVTLSSSSSSSSVNETNNDEKMFTNIILYRIDEFKDNLQLFEKVGPVFGKKKCLVFESINFKVCSGERTS